MQEKSLESTEIFKIFGGRIPPYLPSGARYFALNIYVSELPSIKPSYGPDKVTYNRNYNYNTKITLI